MAFCGVSPLSSAPSSPTQSLHHCVCLYCFQTSVLQGSAEISSHSKHLCYHSEEGGEKTASLIDRVVVCICCSTKILRYPWVVWQVSVFYLLKCIQRKGGNKQQPLVTRATGQILTPSFGTTNVSVFTSLTCPPEIALFLLHTSCMTHKDMIKKSWRRRQIFTAWIFSQKS